MRQEMKHQSARPQNEENYEVSEKTANDQPVDLRITSVIERNKANVNDKPDIKPGNSILLATLLRVNTYQTPGRLETDVQKYNSRVQPDSRDAVHRSNILHRQLTSKAPYYSEIQKRLTSTNSVTYKVTAKPSLNNFVIKKEIDNEILQQSTSVHTNSESIQTEDASSSNGDELTVVYESYKGSPGAYSRIKNVCNVENEPKPIKEFVPNYRKFYSRCYDQSQASKTAENASSSTKKTNIDQYAILRNRLSISRNETNSPLRAALDAPVNFPSVVRPFPLQQINHVENNSESLKRKLCVSANDHILDPNKKDKTLKCLLATSLSEKQSKSKHLQELLQIRPQVDRNYRNGLSEERLRFEAYWTSRQHDYKVAPERASHTRCHNEISDRPATIYCPQAVRPTTNDVVLKGLLVSSSKIPAQIPTTPGPPSSGSPGSESTSSGSTDSGVFSDNMTDDRRRVSRVLSGRHVKSGTGASLTTLRLLRQMIIERRKKNDRKL